MTTVSDAFGESMAAQVARNAERQAGGVDASTRLRTRARITVTGRNRKGGGRDRQQWWTDRLNEAVTDQDRALVLWSWTRADVKRIPDQASAWEFVAEAVAELRADLAQRFGGELR